MHHIINKVLNVKENLPHPIKNWNPKCIFPVMSSRGLFLYEKQHIAFGSVLGGYGSRNIFWRNDLIFVFCFSLTVGDCNVSQAQSKDL